MTTGSQGARGARELAIDELRALCRGALEFLGELALMHLNIDPLESGAPREDPELSFRLRKVCLHVLAVNSWEISADVEHVMASELRAAYLQMEKVWARLPQEYQFYDKRPGLWAEEARNGTMATYDHPTSANLALPVGQGGLGSGEERASYARLATWLPDLAFGYAPALAYLAHIRGDDGSMVGGIATAFEQFQRSFPEPC